MSQSTVWSVIDHSTARRVDFTFKLDGSERNAWISYEALRDHFGAEDEGSNPQNAFDRNSTRIRDVAAAKAVHRGDPDPIQVISGDF